MTSPGLNELVTLVIPAKNRPRQTERLLRSLAASGATYRIILVDDGSRPSLESVARAAELPPLEYVRQAVSQGPSAARNCGLRLCLTPYAAFTDNDVQVRPGWMEALVSHMEQAPPDVAGAGGHVLDDRRSLVGDYATRHGLLDPYRVRGRVAYVTTANCIFRRPALLEIGGFDERFRAPGGEDPDLCFRLLSSGYRIEQVHDAPVVHSYGASWLAFARMFRRYGQGCRQALRSLLVCRNNSELATGMATRSDCPTRSSYGQCNSDGAKEQLYAK